MNKKVVVSFLTAVLVLVGLSSTALAAPVSTTRSLQGETLIGNPPGHVLFSHCNPDGTGYIAYATFGLATGPYQGYFAELGASPLPQ